MSEEGARVKAREINETIRYTCWTAFHIDNLVPDCGAAVVELTSLFEKFKDSDITVRGTYDVSGLRADADYVLWLHAPIAEQLQGALHEFRKTALGSSSTPVWSAMALHRPAEFNKGHVPAFMAGVLAKEWLCVYPFVRSYDWYLLPEEERRGMLIEHGMLGRDFPGIISNTVSAFALGDYEWILALESNDLYEIVDMMRTLRASNARKHVRVEIPFYTGHKIGVNELAGLFA
jgi:chlorite dismutase